MKIEIPAKHLGDIIGIIQNHLDADFFYAHSICICCGNDCKDCTKQILELLGMDHKLTDDGRRATKGSVIWFNKQWNFSSYRKVKKTKISKEKYCAYQFDARSSYYKLPPKEQINYFLGKFDGDLINIGEKSKLSVKEKFEIINKAFCYVGADSGTTHLAMLSNTPVIVLQNKEYPRQWSYPKTNQIKFFTNYIEVLKHIDKLKIKHI